MPQALTVARQVLSAPTGRPGQVLGHTRRAPALEAAARAQPPTSAGSPSYGAPARPDPRRAPRDLRPRAAPAFPAPSLPTPPEARAYLSPACRQYATMMSREWAGRVESRGRVNVGSARDPAAGRSGLRSGRGGASDLPIPPSLAPPGPLEQPLLLCRGIPGSGSQ